MVQGDWNEIDSEDDSEDHHWFEYDAKAYPSERWRPQHYHPDDSEEKNGMEYDAEDYRTESSLPPKQKHWEKWPYWF